MSSNLIGSFKQNYNMDLNRYMTFIIQLLRLISRLFRLVMSTYYLGVVLCHVLVAIGWLQRPIVELHLKTSRWAFRSRANEF
jgi:hypothetical protein